MGLIKAQHVVDGLVAMSAVIDRLAAAGVTMSVPATEGDKPFEGRPTARCVRSPWCGCSRARCR